MTAERLAITTTIDDRGQRVITVGGEVDLATAPHLAGALLELTDRDVAVDLTAVTFLDTSGISALALGNRAVTKAGHRFRTFGEQDHVRRVLEIAGLDKMFH